MKTLLLIFVLLFLCTQSWSDEYDRDYARSAAVFLQLPADAATAALGTTGAAWSTDGGGHQYNPALLSFVGGVKAGVMYCLMPLLQKHQAAEFAYKLPGNIVMDIFYDGYMVYNLEGRDNSGNLTEDFNFHDNALAIGLAGKTIPEFSYGIRARYLSAKLENGISYGYGFDIGISYQPFPFLTLGISGLNIGSKVTWSTGHEDPVLPEGRTGVFFTFLENSLSFGGDLKTGKDLPVDGTVGAEYILFNSIAMRAGLTHFRDLDYSFGTGIRYNEFVIDYSFQRPSSEIGAANRISITFIHNFEE
ncbi:MAG: PorV/PorQ family protein [Fibrobacteria bacterium]|nr:PorV/PorQ family protein [Fibrobacteria bacterium]